MHTIASEPGLKLLSAVRGKPLIVLIRLIAG